jgi:hypothetical protein
VKLKKKNNTKKKGIRERLPARHAIRIVSCKKIKQNKKPPRCDQKTSKGKDAMQLKGE